MPGVTTAYQTGIHSARPTATAGCILYSCTTHGLVYRSDGTTWATWLTLPSGSMAGTPALTFGTSAAAGSSGTFINSDATLPIFDATVPSTQAFSDAAAAGAAGVAARRDHKHGMPASPGGGSLTSSMNQLAADVNITAGTWADGPTLTLAAGTWLLIASITIDYASGAISAELRIYDGTTTYASDEGFMSAATAAVALSCAAIVTPAGSTTFKAQGNSSSTNSKIKAAVPHNGVGNNASTLVAVKIA